VHLPVTSSLLGDEKQPLDPTSFAIDPSAPGFWEVRAHLLAGAFDAELSAHGSTDGTTLEVSAGVTYRAGRLTVGGRVFRVKAVTGDDAGIRFSLGVSF
jgi:hypothetical protein